MEFLVIASVNNSQDCIMSSVFRKEACSFYRMIRKDPARSSYGKTQFLAFISSLPNDEIRNIELIRLTKLHMLNRDLYDHYLQIYRIGIKRDEKEMIESVARRVGLKIHWDEKSGR